MEGGEEGWKKHKEHKSRKLKERDVSTSEGCRRITNELSKVGLLTF